MRKTRPRVLIAHHAATREGIRLALGDVISGCTEAANAQDAIKAAEREQPDVAIVGIELRGGGIAAAEGILRVARRARVVIVTPSQDLDDLLDSVRAGAVGYLPGNVDPAALRRVVRAVASGEAIVPRSLVGELMRHLRVALTGGMRLTTREVQILAMLRGGESTTAIADRLSISPITVRRHISMLMRKTGARTRNGLLDADIRGPVAESSGWTGHTALSP